VFRAAGNGSYSKVNLLADPFICYKRLSRYHIFLELNLAGKTHRFVLLHIFQDSLDPPPSPYMRYRCPLPQEIVLTR
jgi:hypothetical protein